MFKFKNWSSTETTETEEEKFNPEDHKISFDNFLDKRRNAVRPYVFDLRTSEEYEESHLAGAHSLPSEHFENAIYQMPYEGDILLYGSGQGEARSAAEILYENGFDTFYFIEDYRELVAFLKQVKFTITEVAQTQIRHHLQEDSELKGFRVKTHPISAKKAKYLTSFVKAEEVTPEDHILRVNDFDVYVDNDTLVFLEGTQVDFDDDTEVGFTIHNEEWEVKPIAGGDQKEIVQRILTEEINPMVAGHGGFIDLIDIKDNRVYLEFGGGCKGCGMIDVTLKQGVEVVIRENLPDIVEILDVTDHANGTNPYYQPGK